MLVGVKVGEVIHNKPCVKSFSITNKFKVWEYFSPDLN